MFLLDLGHTEAQSEEAWTKDQRGAQTGNHWRLDGDERGSGDDQEDDEVNSSPPPGLHLQGWSSGLHKRLQEIPVLNLHQFLNLSSAIMIFECFLEMRA